MQRKTAIRGAAVLLAGGVLLGTAPAMAADLSSNHRGVAYAYSTGTNTRSAIKDTRADDRSVYVQYYRTSNNEVRTVHNKSGNGTTVTSPSGATVWKLRACEVIEWAPDQCGSWDSSR
ncbi:hypothetical protein [Streptomyces sp. NPDC048603]|uniref:hypothetical protein n=1 Tax=Streptomyces sp. NPDC048603 TaxID=3365577 RepID=UPI00371612AE